MFKRIMLLIMLTASIFLSACGMESLPHGELIASVTSPNKTYIINGYLCDGGATVDYSVRCEVVTVETGKRRNIYWNYREENVDIIWIDDTTVQINQKKLDVIRDYYDWRE